MSEIVFTELRQFNSTANRIDAIIKFNGLIFFSVNTTAAGQVWTYNPITGRFLLNSTFPAGDSVRAFMVMPANTNANFVENTLYGVTGGTDGKLFLYDNDGTWTEKADTGDSTATSLVFYKDNLYYGSNGDEVFKWDGSSQTISLTAAETPGDITALIVFNDLLFAGSTAVGAPQIFVFDNSSWALEDTVTGGGVNAINAFEEFNSDLYASTPKSGGASDLWKRDLVSPVNWVAITSTSQAGIEIMEVFMDRLYFATVTDDSIQRYDGTNFDNIKTAVTGISTYFAAFADGDDCLYFGSAADSTTVSLFSMCPRCSDQVLISGASPFGWNVGDCDITPDICLIEDGCFCEILEIGDCVTIQIKYNGPGTPQFIIEDLDGIEILSQAFVNIVGNVYETEHCFNNQSPPLLGEHKFIVGEPETGDSVWTALTDQGASDLTNIIVITEDIICTTIGEIVTRTSDGGLTWGTVANNAGGGNFISMAYDRVNDIACAVSTGKDVWVSLNQGLSWVQKTDITTTGVNKVTVAGGVIFGSGGSGTVSKSSDNGDSWTAVNVSTARNLTAIFALTNQTVWVGSSGVGDQLHRTTNGGSGWVAQAPAAGTNAFNDIFFFNASAGIAGRTGGALQYTTDGGTTWQTGVTGVASGVNGVFMSSATVGYLSADGGDLLKTADGGATWAAESDALGAIDLTDIDGISDSEGLFLAVSADAGESESFDARTSFIEIASVPCVEIKAEIDCGLLVKYTNDDNFADFDYTNGLVNQIRLRAHFWRVDNPTEQSIHVTSAEEVIATRQVVKKQIMLETVIMPEYMHEKLSIIFSHAAIEIEGITYVAEEGYEHDPFPKNFRQAKGHVLLTDKTYTKENIF